MSFLQPALLLGLPLVLLPIVIHLINQRRFQTVHWGAIDFLLAANQLSKGYARLRRWLILAMRVAAIAALIFAIGRPLSSSWVGAAAGRRTDTAIILLDRSPSMSARGTGGKSKLESAISTLEQTLQVVPPARTVLIDSVNLRPITVESPERLSRLPQSTASSASANVPAMLAVAHQYMSDNQAGRCNVWIASDLASHDWDFRSGRWNALRESLTALPNPVQFHLLALTEPLANNRALRVTEARRLSRGDEQSLRLSLSLEQSGSMAIPAAIPIQLELAGARTQIQLPLTGANSSPVSAGAQTGVGTEFANPAPSAESRAVHLTFEHTIRIESSDEQLWGRVAIDPDVLLADNEYFFVCDRPRPRRCLIVADASTRPEPLRIAASLSPDPEIEYQAETITPEQWAAIDREVVALVIWHASIPEAGSVAERLLSELVDRGSEVIFFPPTQTNTGSFAGMTWGEWHRHAGGEVTSWVADQGLLAAADSGRALPVGDLRISRTRQVVGDFDVLARIDQQTPVLVRSRDRSRNVYFCTTTVSPNDSNLAASGIVLYAMIHRALLRGAEALEQSNMIAAGSAEIDAAQPWQLIAGNPAMLSSERPAHAGVYAIGDQLLAVNRSLPEDASGLLPKAQAESLFEGLEFTLVEMGEVDSGALAREIWRLCLWLMLAALLIEAVLCIPTRNTRQIDAGSTERGPSSVAIP